MFLLWHFVSFLFSFFLLVWESCLLNKTAWKWLLNQISIQEKNKMKQNAKRRVMRCKERGMKQRHNNNNLKMYKVIRYLFIILWIFNVFLDWFHFYFVLRLPFFLFLEENCVVNKSSWFQSYNNMMHLTVFGF